MDGWAGTVLRIDLSSGRIEREPLSHSLRVQYLGGRGINSKILYDEVRAGTDPLGPENVLIFGTGPLVGTLAPAACRFTVSAKSPLTGILGDANCGGEFAPALKGAGYDHLIFSGRAGEPVYLWIEDERAEIRPARHLWGKTTWEAGELIHEELGDPDIQVAAIGPAGENLVRFACIIGGGHRAAGRTGMGAVMGSKNLKAVAVRGTKGVKVAAPGPFLELTAALRKRITENPFYSLLSVYGTPMAAQLANERGLLTIRNFQQSGGFEGIEAIGHERLSRDYFTQSKACFACPIHCSHHFEVRQGPYAGEKGGGIEFGCSGGFGPHCGNSYAPSLFKCTNLCNQLGLDILECSFVLATAMEWYEKGVLTDDDTDGIALRWGNYQAIIEMIPRIARREGIGGLLAEGVVRAAQQLGRGAERYISHSKGMTYGTDEVRALKGYAMSLATSTRGADHLRGLPGVEYFGGLSPEEARARFGSEEAADPTSYKKASMVIYYQHLCTLADCLEVCKFNTEMLGQELSFQEMRELFALATGVPMSEKEMLQVAERVYNLERAFLVREGITRKDDVLEGKWATEPVQNGPYQGEAIDPDRYGQLLDEYYLLRGWDPETGIPCRPKLEELGLGKVADDMERRIHYFFPSG